jgi:nucleoprotein TPR
VNEPSGDIITDHLVEFKSIRSLQEQNIKLLKLTRGLMAKLDTREINRATADEDDEEIGDNLDKATETIHKLLTQLLESQKRVNDTIRERDFFSKLLAKGEGLRGPGSIGGGEAGEGVEVELVGTLKAELEGMRAKAERDVEELRVEVKGKNEAVGKLEIEKARAESKVALLEGQLLRSLQTKYELISEIEQHRMLNDANGLQKQEFANVESELRQVQGTVNQANNEKRSVNLLELSVYSGLTIV